jgi:ribosome-binding protein aMBF1 (putative translation factor)
MVERETVQQDESISPIGTPAVVASRRGADRSPTYRAQRNARQGFREIAWLIIKYRMETDLTQQQLADRMGTSYSQISRIESGRHPTSIDTLQRIAHALDLQLVVGFQSQSSEKDPQRDLVAL